MAEVFTRRERIALKVAPSLASRLGAVESAQIMCWHKAMRIQEIAATFGVERITEPRLSQIELLASEAKQAAEWRGMAAERAQASSKGDADA